MVPTRFHFDVENGDDLIRDWQGVEADDLAQAIEQAKLGVAELRAVGDLDDTQGWTLVIRDEDGIELYRLAI